MSITRIYLKGIEIFTFWIVKEIFNENCGVAVIKIDQVETVAVFIWGFGLEHEILEVN